MPARGNRRPHAVASGQGPGMAALGRGLCCGRCGRLGEVEALSLSLGLASAGALHCCPFSSPTVPLLPLPSCGMAGLLDGRRGRMRVFLSLTFRFPHSGRLRNHKVPSDRGFSPLHSMWCCSTRAAWLHMHKSLPPLSGVTETERSIDQSLHACFRAVHITWTPKELYAPIPHRLP
jgi:hypothetical protein